MVENKTRKVLNKLLTVILQILDGPVFTGTVLFHGHEAFGMCRHRNDPFRQAHAEGVVSAPNKEQAIVASNKPARQPTKQPKNKRTPEKPTDECTPRATCNNCAKTKRIRSKRWTLTSYVSWSIGFEVPLTESLAHHFLDYRYANLCVQCAHFMRKFAPTKTFKTPSKNDCKNHQTPTNPKNYVTLLFECFTQYATKRYKKRKNWAFCLFRIVPTESSLWKKHGHDDSWWQVWTLCLCVHITMQMGVHDLSSGRQFETPGFFHGQIL